MLGSKRATVLALAMGLALAGCASTGGGGSRGSSDVVTREEIEDASQTTALDLIRALRPQWLRIRGSMGDAEPIMVYVDGTRRGPAPDALRGIRTNLVEEIRFYDSREAQFEFGLGNANGAIAITSRSSR